MSHGFVFVTSPEASARFMFMLVRRDIHIDFYDKVLWNNRYKHLSQIFSIVRSPRYSSFQRHVHMRFRIWIPSQT